MKLLGNFGHVSLALLLNALLATCQWHAAFNPNDKTILIDDIHSTHLVLSGLSTDAIANINNRDYLQILSYDEQVAVVEYPNDIVFTESHDGSNSWETNIYVRGVFLGNGEQITLYVECVTRTLISLYRLNNHLRAKVYRWRSGTIK